MPCNRVIRTMEKKMLCTFKRSAVTRGAGNDMYACGKGQSSVNYIPYVVSRGGFGLCDGHH